MYRLIRASVISALIAFVFSACGSSREASPTTSAQKQPIVEDPSVVAVVGNERITLQEFEREYARSEGGRENAVGDSLAAYEDFLSRYVNFRLKVAEAHNAGLASDSGLQAEAAAYRNSIARPYMIEQEILAPIMQDIFERVQEVVSTSHILLSVAPNAAPADTLAAYNRASALLDSLENGADFAELAREYSEDPSAQNASGPGAGGFLGFQPTGALVPEFEDMAYNTPVGEVSPVFRTQFGYHILQVNNREAAVPDVRVAHIMAIPGDPAPDPGAFLDSLKALIDAGEDFGTLAREHSVHQESAQRGGDLGFYLSHYTDNGAPPSFKEAAFQLQNVGDVSEIIQTPFGFHLIQLLERRDPGNYVMMEEQLKQMASRSPRALKAQREYLEDIHSRYNLTVDSTFIFNTLAGFEVDSLANVLRTKALPAETLSHTVLQLGDSTYSVADFATFATRVSRPVQQTTRDQVTDLLNVYISEVTANYATETLEQRNEEFRTMMDDFRDGLLLFQIMQDSVWNAASEDSTALLAHYQVNAAKYQYPERTRTIIFHADETDILQRVSGELDKGRSPAEIQTAFAADSLNHLRIDTTFVSGATNSIYDRVLAIEEGAHTEPLRAADGYVILLRDGQEAARPKTFQEARAEVISEYQEILEEDLINRLQEKYRVQTYPQRLENAFDDDNASPATSLTVK